MEEFGKPRCEAFELQRRADGNHGLKIARFQDNGLQGKARSGGEAGHNNFLAARFQNRVAAIN